MFINRVFSVVIIALISATSFSQTSNDNHSNDKSICHTLDIEPFSIGYSISQKLNKKSYFGFGIQIGASFRYFLNNPTFLKKSIVSDTVNRIIYKSTKLKPAIKYSYEIAQIKFFYRHFVLSKGYISLGAYFGFGFLTGIEASKAHFSAGALCDFFWGGDHFKLGSRLQIGNTHIAYNAENKTNIFSILITPIIVQVYF